MRKNTLALFSLFSLISFSGISGMDTSDQDVCGAMLDEPCEDVMKVPPSKLVKQRRYSCCGTLYCYVGCADKNYYFWREAPDIVLQLTPFLQSGLFVRWMIGGVSEKKEDAPSPS